MTVRAIFEASLVNRWHRNSCHALRNSGDTTGAHCGRVARLALWLWPDRHDLIAAALTHDDGEGGPHGIGDMDGLAKRTLPARLRVGLERHEADVRRGLWGRCHLSDLSDEDRARLKFLDLLDAFIWAKSHAPDAIKSDAWRRDRAWLLSEGESFGVIGHLLDVLGRDE